MSNVEVLTAGVGAGHGVTIILQQVMEETSWNAVTSAQAQSDFLAGSGLTRIDQIGAIAKLVGIVIGLFIAIWAIIAEFRAWGADNSDSFGLFMTVIRGCALGFFIVITLSTIV